MDKKLKDDDYTNPEPSDEDNVFRGTSPELGTDNKVITPGGEILDEEDLLADDEDTDSFNDVAEDGEMVPGTEADLTADDFEALGPVDLSMDMGDDEELKHRTYPVDFAGKDLDVPGSELDDDQENIGSEDEENNNYSIGDNQ